MRAKPCSIARLLLLTSKDVRPFKPSSIVWVACGLSIDAALISEERTFEGSNRASVPACAGLGKLLGQ